jgi:two-component system response regulator FixJ
MPGSEPIYVVDDDAAVRDSMRMILESYGLSVFDYASAQQFLDDTTAHAGNGCLVLDHHMPHMSGLELLDKLRAWRISIPVVMVTGRSDAKLKDRARAAGAAVLLDKPVSDGDLLQAIELATADVASLN